MANGYLLGFELEDYIMEQRQKYKKQKQEKASYTTSMIYFTSYSLD